MCSHIQTLPMSLGEFWGRNISPDLPWRSKNFLLLNDSGIKSPGKSQKAPSYDLIDNHFYSLNV